VHLWHLLRPVADPEADGHAEADVNANGNAEAHLNTDLRTDRDADPEADGNPDELTHGNADCSAGRLRNEPADRRRRYRPRRWVRSDRRGRGL
jgi:hypothetical protein